MVVVGGDDHDVPAVVGLCFISVASNEWFSFTRLLLQSRGCLPIRSFIAVISQASNVGQCRRKGVGVVCTTLNPAAAPCAPVPLPE